MLNKNSYFQGTEEPTPKKKKYKSEPALMVQPRFKEPFYRNYDYAEADGVNGKAQHGPGVGWNEMGKYKSIQEFLAAKRQKMKDKYKSDVNNDCITDNNRQERIQRMKIQADYFLSFVKLAIDFPVDDQINSSPIIGDSESYLTPIQLGPNDGDLSIYPTETNLGEFESYPYSAQIGGFTDKYLGQPDLDDKPESDLDWGYDLTDGAEEPYSLDADDLDRLMKKYLTPSPNHGQFGLPDGVDLPDEDAGFPTNLNPFYDETNVGITMYEDKWNV